MERDTLYQLRNLINRRNVTRLVKSDVNSNEDFLELCSTGYILVSVKTIHGMSDIHKSRLPSVVSLDLWMEDDSVRKAILQQIATSVVDACGSRNNVC